MIASSLAYVLCHGAVTLTYMGGALSDKLGFLNVVNNIYGKSNIFLSTAPPSSWKSLNSSYTGVNQYVLSSITVIASFEPTTAKVAFLT